MAPEPQKQTGDTLEESGAGGSVFLAAGPHLFLAIEADRPSAGGARYALAGIDEVLIGRGDERSVRRARKGSREQLVVRVPGRWMSGAHARILRVRGEWVLEDAGSRNGTYVGGERVKRRTLGDGDVIEAGHSIFLLRSGLPTPASSPDDLDAADLRALSPGLRTLVPALAARHDELARVARSDVPIVFLGETGTGKEVLARATHELSGRKGGFVAVNCGSLSPALVEGLLFGHVKGSFSGAMRDEPGFVRAADGGTLFLDEIGDFPASAQPSLLRVLQEREVVPVGSSRPMGVEIRVIAATHRDLDALVAGGAFRRDLLMRLDGFRHALTPLGERREDIGLLVADLLARRTDAATVTFTREAIRALFDRAWPGNVRELDQALARALALAMEGPIDVAHLALPLASAEPDEESSKRPSSPESPPPSDDERRALLAEALTVHKGNIVWVARALRTSRSQVHRWLRRFNLSPEDFRS